MEAISKPSELLGLMASTSTQIDIFSDGIIQAVKEGEINPITVAVQLKAMKTASERIAKEISPELMTEVSKYPEANFEFMGNKISKAEHGTKYDFSKCNHPRWNELTAEIEELTKELKATENFLKAIKEPLEVILGDEVLIVTPPTKTSTSGINISIR